MPALPVSRFSARVWIYTLETIIIPPITRSIVFIRQQQGGLTAPGIQHENMDLSPKPWISQRTICVACINQQHGDISVLETQHKGICPSPQPYISHLTLSVASCESVSSMAASSPPWFSMSARGTIMRTPTPPPFAAEPNVRECTTYAMCGRRVYYL